MEMTENYANMSHVAFARANGVAATVIFLGTTISLFVVVAGMIRGMIG